MTTVLRSSTLAVALACVSTAALAQTPAPSPSQTPSATSASDAETRPATTTFFGDTGIWYVPTGEVLANGTWSASAYRRGTNWIQGYTNVADFAGTFAYGLKDRAEIFGSFLVDTRIDRDLRPLFANDPSVGGVIDRYPRVAQPWTGDNVGDLYLGAKINLWSEYRQNPVAIAVRGMVKLPTGKTDAGVSTGKADGSVDLIVSKEAAKLVEISGFGGYEFRGSPDNYDAPTGAFRWGTGVAFPSRNFLRLSAELNGELPNKDTITYTGIQALCINCGLPPTVSNTSNLTRATLGLTFQSRKGFFAGAGVSWNVPTRARSGSFTDEPDVIGDYYDMQFRIGYHPGVRVYTPPPPPPPPQRIEPPPHTLTVKAACDPCTVEVGGNSTVTATVQDSISCAVTYRWSAPSGTLAQPAERVTRWTAGAQAGSVPITITVTCPSDNKTASDTVNIQVTAPPPPKKRYEFEDVYFDFDRYSLRPEATRVLDEAIAAMRDDATLKIEVEGHTCNIGTAEYNLALGDRRASSVKDYLTSRGVSADRLRSVSYGEERPKYDNSREETRRLNRRAALVVNLR
jgi:outer membrane protein OmpA-like peptidoglycan-associated protein